MVFICLNSPSCWQSLILSLGDDYGKCPSSRKHVRDAANKLVSKMESEASYIFLYTCKHSFLLIDIQFMHYEGNTLFSNGVAFFSFMKGWYYLRKRKNKFLRPSKGKSWKRREIPICIFFFINTSGEGS